MSSANNHSAFSDESTPLSRARQRRGQRLHQSENQNEQRPRQEALVHQLTASYDFFLLSLLSGLILAASLAVQSRALLFLGILLAPFLGPVIGLGLFTVTGSARFLLQSILSLLISGLFIFGFGALAGALTPLLPFEPSAPITEWNQLQLVNFLLVAVGAGVSVYRLVRMPRQKPLIASAAMAYGLLPPVAAAGFNLTAASASDWAAPLASAGIHLLWAVLICIVMFILLGFPPRNLGSYLLTALVIGLLVTPFIPPYGSKNLILVITPTEPASIVAATPTPTIGLTPAMPPTTTSTQRAISTVTPTPNISATPSITPTQTITPIPTPIIARISAPTGGGAYLRDNPDGKIISSILNGNLIEVISEPIRGKNGVIWVQIRTADGFSGWIVQSLLATATPSAGW